jgi:transcriptional regulator with XRE-family HTH domain
MPLTSKQLRDLRQSDARGNRLAKAIELAELTQLAVVAGTGLTQQYVSDVVRTASSNIKVQNAHKFAEFFGCSIEDLFPSQQREVV